MNDQGEEEPSGVISSDENEDKKDETEESSLQVEEKQHARGEENKPQETQLPVQQPIHEDTSMNQHQHAVAAYQNHIPCSATTLTHPAVVSNDIGASSNSYGPAIPSHHLVPSQQQQQQQQYYQPYPSMMMDATRQYFEARMRDHAAAYATAAAGAAWAAAQMAAAAADFAAGHGPPPHQLMLAAQQQQEQKQQQQQEQQSWFNTCSVPPHSFGDALPMNHPLPPLLYSQQPPSPMMSTSSGGPSPPSNNMMAPYPHPWGVLPLPHSSHAPQEAGPDVENDDRNEDVSSSYQHRRKRRPQNFASSSDQDAGSIPRKVVVGPQHQQQRGKIRRRLRSDGDSSSSGSSFYYNSRRYNGSNNNNSSSNTSSKNYSSSRRTYNQKKKARSDESLLGKTAVAALYEWCSRRRNIIMPVFVLQQEGSKGEEFECTVYLDELQEKAWGKGRGTNKNAAKQKAAQQALQTLCPEVLFDEATGLVKEVPATGTMPFPLFQAQQGRSYNNNKNNNSNKNSSLEDLAPNLAKQLAIGSSNTPSTDATGNSATLAATPTTQSPPRQLHSQLKRSLELHSGGGTTTTSTSDDDENSYYGGSRGASVLSGLLFRIISIDPRTPNPPSFVYHFDPNNSSLKRKTNVEKNTRGRFTCTAQLEIHNEKEEEAQDKGGELIDPPREQKDAAGEEAGLASKENDRQSHHDTSVRIISAQGAGASKREARQIACAHLLALLFPECETLVDVKEAAEARHALYAASKLKKNAGGGCRNIDFALALPSDPPLPRALQQDLETILNQSTVVGENSGEEHESNKNDTSSLASSCTSVLRQHGRKMQLDALVEKTLQNLNERDEEGRCLPEELTDDDVGRTLLRRAEPGDMDWIRNLLLYNQRGGQSSESTKLLSTFKMDSPPSRSRSKSLDVEDDQIDSEQLGDVFTRLWSPSSIVLLLCRAIAAYEDPPLGCAILTVDFCLERGRLLRITRLATESHLPQERFLECLQDFAGCMQCKLELQSKEDNAAAPSIRLTRSGNRRIIRSYLNKSESDKKNAYAASTSPINAANLTLQSVQEEDSELSDSSAEKRPARPSSKPSKRSRFQ